VLWCCPCSPLDSHCVADLFSQQASNFARAYPLDFSVPSATTVAPVNPSPFAVGNRWDGQHNFGTRGDGGLSWLDPQLLSSVPSVPWVPSPVTSWPGVAGAANNLNPPQGQGHFGGQSLLSDLGYLAPYGHASSPVYVPQPASRLSGLNTC
jgi:hypothetical protein